MRFREMRPFSASGTLAVTQVFEGGGRFWPRASPARFHVDDRENGERPEMTCCFATDSTSESLQLSKRLYKLFMELLFELWFQQKRTEDHSHPQRSQDIPFSSHHFQSNDNDDLCQHVSHRGVLPTFYCDTHSSILCLEYWHLVKNKYTFPTTANLTSNFSLQNLTLLNPYHLDSPHLKPNPNPRTKHGHLQSLQHPSPPSRHHGLLILILIHHHTPLPHLLPPRRRKHGRSGHPIQPAQILSPTLAILHPHRTTISRQPPTLLRPSTRRPSGSSRPLVQHIPRISHVAQARANVAVGFRREGEDFFEEGQLGLGGS